MIAFHQSHIRRVSRGVLRGWSRCAIRSVIRHGAPRLRVLKPFKPRLPELKQALGSLLARIEQCDRLSHVNDLVNGCLHRTGQGEKTMKKG